MAKSTPHLYPVVLSDKQRAELEAVCSSGSGSARKIRRARVLLLSDRNRPDGKLSRDQVADMIDIHVNSVDRIRKRFFEEGPQEAIVRKPHARPPVLRKIDGKMEGQIIAICCSPAPQGRARWTLRLLVDQIKKRKIITSISIETVRQTLKKTNCSLGGKNPGASPKGTQRGS